MTPGTVIILNGTSSSGKTSIVKAWQTQVKTPYLDAGIDKFLWMLPGRFLNTALWQEIYTYTTGTVNGKTAILSIKPAPLGLKLISGMHHAIAALARAGNNVIADHVLTEPAWVQECAALFANLPAYFIGVRCPLHVLEQREKDRRDRTLGQARAQFNAVHAHGVYDFEVDTSRHDVNTCVRRIRQFVDGSAPPAAFARLQTAVSPH